ncbi:MAG: isoamylase early set domain-containing protein [Bacteroidota bacterium]
MIDKKVSAKGTKARVSFELPAEAAENSVAVVGDFNEWNPEANPMKLLKKGTWKATISLDTGSNYQFRYLLDNQTWRNDEEADAYVPNEFAEENCVLEL